MRRTILNCDVCGIEMHDRMEFEIQVPESFPRGQRVSPRSKVKTIHLCTTHMLELGNLVSGFIGNLKNKND